MNRRPKSEPHRVEAVLGRVLDDLGLGSARLAMRAQEAWPELVGADAAAHSNPTLLRGATLEVRVDASVWGHQLSLRSAEIIERLRALLGSAAPTQLRFWVGPP